MNKLSKLVVSFFLIGSVFFIFSCEKEDTVATVCEDLTDTQSEKVKELAKGVDYENEGQYTEKLEMIVENYFPTAQVKSEEGVTNDDNSDEENTEKLNAPLMEEYAKAISRANTK